MDGLGITVMSFGGCRRDSFVTHRAFCDALAQESAQVHSLSVGSSPATSSAVLSPVLSINQTSDMQENTIGTGVTTCSTSAGCSTSSPSNCDGNANANANGNVLFVSSMFAPLSGFSPSISQPQTQSSCLGLNLTMPNSDRAVPYSIEPPPALSLSSFYQFPSNAAPSIFPLQEQDHWQYSAPAPHPTMSATALLQKAAQMGASASGSSLLCGFGLTVASPRPSLSEQEKCVKPDNGSPVTDGLGLVLPLDGDFNGSGPMVGDPSGFFVSKPMTLDLLGLGIGPENSSTGAFPAYLSSIGSPLDVAAAFGAESSAQLKGSWEGQAAQRKPNETVL